MAWLTAAPGHNAFLGFGPNLLTSPDRLRSLWAEHAAEIRDGWREQHPESIPFGHPILEEMPAELRNEPDPRCVLADGRESERYHVAVREWQRRRREWFRDVAD